MILFLVRLCDLVNAKRRAIRNIAVCRMISSGCDLVIKVSAEIVKVMVCIKRERPEKLR